MMSASDFVWDEFFWVTTTRLRDQRLANSPVRLTFAPEGRGAEALTTSELVLTRAAVEALDDHVALAVDALYGRYEELQELFGFDDVERAKYMPNIDSIDGLCELIEVAGVFVHPIERSGEPYVGIEFNCSWDPEHGAGVLVNGTRVVDVGGADTAILLWIARRDRDE